MVKIKIDVNVEIWKAVERLISEIEESKQLISHLRREISKLEDRKQKHRDDMHYIAWHLRRNFARKFGSVILIGSAVGRFIDSGGDMDCFFNGPKKFAPIEEEPIVQSDQNTIF